MLSYCLKCRKNTESKNPKVVRNKNRRIMLLSNYVMCNSKKSKFTKEQETTGTAQKMKFSTKDFFSKCEQICSKLQIWSYLLKKILMENFIFCAVWIIK